MQDRVCWDASMVHSRHASDFSWAGPVTSGERGQRTAGRSSPRLVCGVRSRRHTLRLTQSPHQQAQAEGQVSLSKEELIDRAEASGLASKPVRGARPTPATWGAEAGQRGHGAGVVWVLVSGAGRLVFSVVECGVVRQRPSGRVSSGVMI